MSSVFGIIGMLVFLFAFCYFIAALGNHGRYVQRHENDFGCAIILFVLLLIYGLFKGLSGH